jgi:hypothetical protein
MNASDFPRYDVAGWTLTPEADDQKDWTAEEWRVMQERERANLAYLLSTTRNDFTIEEVGELVRVEPSELRQLAYWKWIDVDPASETFSAEVVIRLGFKNSNWDAIDVLEVVRRHFVPRAIMSPDAASVGRGAEGPRNA